MNHAGLRAAIRSIAIVAGLGALATAGNAGSDDHAADARKPNIIVIYADDLGYGDVGAYGGEAVDTPYLDAMAAGGVRFTDGHATAATCTPSRYSLLTGEYAFRRDAQIQPGDAPLLIDPARETVASFLQDQGYATAVVGKWHLGLGQGDIDWARQITPGANEVGFSYSFLLPATGDRVPSVYVENGYVLEADPNDPVRVSYKEDFGEMPAGENRPDLVRMIGDAQHNNTIVNGVPRIGYQAGGEAALFVDEEFPDVWTGKAIDFMSANKDKPFFLFFSHHDPHVPRLPHPRFQGITALGPRGDAIAQLDWMTGRIIESVAQLGLANDTLIIFTSDNGPVLNDGYRDGAEAMNGDHMPAGPLRGGKYSAFEAGARVPTIAYWPGTIQPTVSDAMISQVDFFRSFAQLIGAPVPDGEAPDSMALIHALLGHTQEGRTSMLVESGFGLTLRDGDWKYIRPNTGREPPAVIQRKNIESGGSTGPQLYHLGDDLGEQNNLADAMPERVRVMHERIEAIMATPGFERENTE